MTGEPLDYTQFGKPYPIQYEYATALLHTEALELGFDGIDLHYCVG